MQTDHGSLVWGKVCVWRSGEWGGRTSLASSRVNRRRVGGRGMGPSVEAAAAAAAVTPTTSGSVMVVA